MNIRSTASLLIAISIAWHAAGHDQIPGSAQSKPIVIRSATIHIIDGPAIDNGSVVFVDGKITAVSKKVVVPPKTIEIDAKGLHVYPGLIESMTDIGLREISSISATDDRTEFGDRNPNANALVAVNPDSELIPVARAGGVLIAMTAPRGRWIRGQASVIQLDGWTARDMSLRSAAGLYVDWTAMEPRDDDEKKRIEKRTEKHSQLDALLEEARRYRKGRDHRPERTATDLRLESLLPVLDGHLPVIAEANDQATIESAVAYSQRQKLKLIIYGGYDAPQCAQLLNQYGVPVIVAGTHRLPARRNDPYDAAYTLPSRLRQSKIKFCIGGAGAGSPGGAASARNLPYHAATAVAYGLPHADAVRAITLSAAEVLGIADQVGSITEGKDATLIIADGDILESGSNVTQAWIQGREVDLGSRHKTLYQKYRKKYSQ
ncbi:MAG: amidohydrolase family protein [Pirellulaceae bacterium]|nr:amidohydrolase family protein [Pirellulaceae bacterium]